MQMRAGLMSRKEDAYQKFIESTLYELSGNDDVDPLGLYWQHRSQIPDRSSSCACQESLSPKQSLALEAPYEFSCHQSRRFEQYLQWPGTAPSSLTS
jgi:hypothetical protein